MKMNKVMIVDKYYGQFRSTSNTVFIQVADIYGLGDAIRVAKRMRPDKIEICLELNKGDEF